MLTRSSGGANPALRTFYYRLLRLIALSIHPIFVFDGPNKPPFKRNKRTGPNVASIPEFLAKQLLKQFGFPIHLAPGEAEAECALLQREGIVDAVLSEDVDTLMFGSGLTIRNWSPEQKSSKTPTHVNVYDAKATKDGPAGLDREGMILIALMSGGDYVPEGIPGCGPKAACEAARAGFGADLCKIARNDKKGMREWRERLQHEIKTNESKFFKNKRPSMKIPDDFPRIDILGYYTHPVISSQAGLRELRSIKWDKELDFSGLREFTGDAFDWVKLEGAKHFIRSLAPSLLVRRLRLRGEQGNQLPPNDLQAIEEDEALLVKGIHGKRQHAVTDSTTELRVSFTPIELVKIDLSKEEPDEELDNESSGTLIPEADLDDEIPLEFDEDAEPGPKKRAPTKFDPQKPARVWVLETFVKVGVPLKVQDWEAGRSKPMKQKRAATAPDTSKLAPKARRPRQAKTASDSTQATMESFAKITKPSARLAQALSKAEDASTTSIPDSQSRRTIVDLLSSSPARSISRLSPPFNLSEEKSLSIVSDFPSSITKRPSRALQRSQTSPCAPSSARMQMNSLPLDKIETLNLVDLPPLPSQLPAQKARLRGQNPAASTSPGKSKQSTLDAWGGSPITTPTKPKSNASTKSSASDLAEPKLSEQTDEIETLDLTIPSLSRPERPPRRSYPKQSIASIFTSRPALVSISSNTLNQSSSSSTSQSSQAKSSQRRPPPRQLNARRRSPRLLRTSSSSTGNQPLDADQCTSLPTGGATEIETYDLTALSSSPAIPSHSSVIESLDLTDLSTPPSTSANPSRRAPQKPNTAPPPSENRSNQPPPISPKLRRSPRVGTTLSSERQPSPPAAWKSQAKKKREIRLRTSLAGAWDYIDVESPEKAGGFIREDAVESVVLKDKYRRRWRESEIEMLDLT